MSYTPGLEITKSTLVRKIRELPLLGKSHVKPGDKVSAETNVLSAELPGDLQIIRLADRMMMEVQDVLPGIKIVEGARVSKGELLCEVKTFFGLFTSSLESPTDAEVEFITNANAHIGLRKESTPLEVNAYIDGKVVEVEDKKSVTIETNAALIQGIFGVGGERRGTIHPLDIAADKIVDASDLKEDLKDKIIFGGAQFTVDALNKAAELGAKAVVTGSIDAKTLAAFVGYEIGVSITGDEEVPLTLIITEGFGELPISDRVLKLAKEFSQKDKYAKY